MRTEVSVGVCSIAFLVCPTEMQETSNKNVRGDKRSQCQKACMLCFRIQKSNLQSFKHHFQNMSLHLGHDLSHPISVGGFEPNLAMENPSKAKCPIKVANYKTIILYSEDPGTSFHQEIWGVNPPVRQAFPRALRTRIIKTMPFKPHLIFF